MSFLNSIEFYSLLSVFVSFLVFIFINKVLVYLIPKSAQTTSRQAWKWKNIMNSLIHSFIAGIWAVGSFYRCPQMAEDLINFHTPFDRTLVAFSIGYFVHDLIDLACNHRKRSSYELMVHHMFVILCFGFSVVSHVGIGYSVVALLVEINSVFLHLRQILIIIGTPKSDYWYRLNALMNIATYIIFRIAVLGWMTRWLVLHRDDISFFAYSLGSIGLAVIIVMNTVLFIRICSVDFSYKRKADVKNLGDSSSKRSTKENEIASSGLFSSTPNFRMD